MMKYSLLLAASLLVLAGSDILQAQEAPSNPMQGQSYGGGMDHMGGQGMMLRHGMMMRPGMMRMIVVMMDTDGDGALSLEEVQSVHARMFKAMDADKNGRVTIEEIQQFFGGY
jgi:EF hand